MIIGSLFATYIIASWLGLLSVAIAFLSGVLILEFPMIAIILTFIALLIGFIAPSFDG